MGTQTRKLWPQWLLINNETWHAALLAGALNAVLSLCFIAAFFRADKLNLALFSGVFLVSVVRMLLSWAYRRKFSFEQRVHASGWDAAFAATVLISGAFWSFSLYRIMSTTTDSEIMLITQATLFALISASTLSLGKTRFLFALYAFPLMIADGWYLLNHYSSPSVLVLSLGAILTFGIFVIYQQRVFYETWKRHQQQSRDLRSILDSIPGGVSLVENGKYTFVNSFVRDLTGLGDSEFDGRQVGFSNPDSALINQVRQFTSSGTDHQMSEVRLGPPGHEKYHFLILKKLPSESHEKLLILAFNIEKKKQLEKQSEDQQAQMIASAKFAALGEMAAGICHEINNPLAVITGLSETLMRRASSGDLTLERQLRDLDKIRNTGFRISKIIRGLRTFSRDASHDPKTPATVDQIVRDALSICEARLRNCGIELRTRLDPSLIISCRPSEISQVVLNAINNSLDSLEKSPEPKWVEIETVFVAASEKVRIYIRDNGPGIPAEIRERVMTPFFTTKEVGKGTGLGLSISKGIIHAHEGQMFFNFQAPCTELVIELPCAAENDSGFQAA